ncbi:MAG: DUF2066 domain-containing protein [Lysobacteraceae bacterium]
MRPLIASFFAGLLLLGVQPFGSAKGDELSLYEASVPVKSQSPGERARMLPSALAQVIAKVTGQRNAGQSPAIRGSMGQATQIVQDTRYTTEQKTIAGVPVYGQRMIASFDHDAVDALIAGSGLPVWPSPRPKPLLWLVIDDGKGPRMVNAAHVNVVRTLTERGNDRGIAFQLPNGSASESAAAMAAAWQGQAQAVAAPSAAYGTTLALVGKLARGAGGWTASWLLMDGNTELNRWTETNPDPRAAMANAADTSGDVLARKYARVVSGGPAGVFAVEVDGIGSGDDYLRLMGYLQGMGVVRHIVLLDASGDKLRMQLDLAHGIQGFRSLVSAGHVLQAGGDGSTAMFRLQR